LGERALERINGLDERGGQMLARRVLPVAGVCEV
jgi:hypothetical protein